MKFNDFNWEDIIYEAPGDAPDAGGDDLAATDYTDTGNLDVSDVSSNEDLGAEDYTQTDDSPPAEAEAEKRITVLMGDEVGPRREWIDTHVSFTLEDDYVGSRQEGDE